MKGVLPDLERLRREAEARLSPKRYRHSIAVQKQAVRLAALHGGDWYRAAAAGLVHDICKEMDPDVQLNYLHRCGILLDILTLEYPGVWHAVTGAEVLRRELGIRDPGILSAVRYHTTGRAGMSLLEKVLYVADLTSEDRSFPDIGRVRMLAERSLDRAVAYSQRFIVEGQVRKGKPVLRDAWECYNHYIGYMEMESEQERESSHDIL